MVTPRDASVPARFPWDEWGEITKRLDRLITLEELRQGLIPQEQAVQVLGLPSAMALREIIQIREITGVREVVSAAPGPTEQLVSLVRESVPEAIGDSYVIPFQKTVAVATQDEQDRNLPFTGVIRDVIMAFPAGCHQLVEVRLVYYPAEGSRVTIVPSLDDTFIALDDFTAVFQPRRFVVAPGHLRVEWYNYDELNTHTVPVLVTLTPTSMVAPGEFPAPIPVPLPGALPPIPEVVPPEGIAPPAGAPPLPPLPTPEEVSVPTGVTVVRPEQPRLVLAAAYARPTRVEQGSPVTLFVPVAHEGPPMGPRAFSVSVIEEAAAKKIPLGSFSVSPAPNQMTTTEIPWQVPENAALGDYGIEVTLGPIVEAFHDRFTVLRKMVPVIPVPVAAPELQMGEPRVSRAEVAPGETVNIDLPFTNPGQVFPVEITTVIIDPLGSAVQEPTVSTTSLSRGSSTRRVSWRAPDRAVPGSYTLQVFVRDVGTGTMLVQQQFSAFSVSQPPPVEREWGVVTPPITPTPSPELLEGLAVLKRLQDDAAKRAQEAEGARNAAAKAAADAEKARLKAEQLAVAGREQARAAADRAAADAAAKAQVAKDKADEVIAKAQGAIDVVTDAIKAVTPEELRRAAFMPAYHRLRDVRKKLSTPEYTGREYAPLMDELNKLQIALGEIESGDVPLSQLQGDLSLFEQQLDKFDSTIARYQPDTSLKGILAVLWRLVVKYTK